MLPPCPPQVFEGDGTIPAKPLPEFNHDSNSTVGMCVLIPASKYPAFAKIDSNDRADFVGWVGQLQGYEAKKSKMRVKIKGDQGYEHLPVRGANKYAIQSLVRLT